MVIKLTNVNQSFGDKKVLEIEQLEIQEREKIGIVGINGSGKTTLFRILAGEIKPDTGNIWTKEKITYLPQFDQEIEKLYLSGGEKRKSKLQEVFWENKQQDSILLLDEPTCNLDAESIEQLKGRLQKYQGTLLVISHDRYLLDEICNGILEIDHGKVRKFKGNYRDYQEQKRSEQERLNFEQEQYRREKNRLKKAMQERKTKAKEMRETPKRMGNSEARLHKREVNQKKEKIEGHAKSLETRLEQLEKNKGQIRQEIYRITMKMPEENRIKSRFIVRAEDISLEVAEKIILEHAQFYVPANEITALTGVNGSGKTTLIKAILGEIDCSTIYVNPAAKISYFRQDFSHLIETKTVLENVKEESKQNEITIRNILANLAIKENKVNQKVSLLSGGEKVKVALAKILVADSNFLILDEPTNFLDIVSIEALEQLLKDYQGTVLFVTHDKRMVEQLANHVLEIQNKTIIQRK